jgi:hypothetical protein
MALISSFVHKPNARAAFRTEVECGWVVGEHDGRPVLHLETYGSSSRSIPGKVSQSIELDEGAARELMTILRGAFPRL